ncbi:betaine--homocysteine S-methyltransferase 1-like isoform X2 [Branchiostoma floridae x Branchiostoma japonicum]
MATKPKGLLDRLKAGETVICAEGYLFEFERRGYLKAGPFAPEVVVEHPELVKGLHREFAHAGSDVVLAFTYYGHRETLRAVGREDELETFNRTALKLAREVADETGTLMAGNICNTNCYNADDPQVLDRCRQIFKEQTEWAVSEGADFVVAETFHYVGEALLALECVKQYGNGLPAVVTFSVSRNGLWCGHTVEEAMTALEEAGAAVVGLNCGRGPATMLPLMDKVVNKVKVLKPSSWTWMNFCVAAAWWQTSASAVRIWVCSTWVCAVGTPHTSPAPWQRPWVAPRPPVNTLLT